MHLCVCLQINEGRSAGEARLPGPREETAPRTAALWGLALFLSVRLRGRGNRAPCGGGVEGKRRLGSAWSDRLIACNPFLTDGIPEHSSAPLINHDRNVH